MLQKVGPPGHTLLVGVEGKNVLRPPLPKRCDKHLDLTSTTWYACTITWGGGGGGGGGGGSRGQGLSPTRLPLDLSSVVCIQQW